MAPRTAFNSDSERRMFTANLNWYIAKHFGTQKRSVTKAADEAGLNLCTLCDAKNGKVSINNAEVFTKWLGHSFETLCTQKLSNEVPTPAPTTIVNPITGRTFAASPKVVTKRPKHRSGQTLKAAGLTFTLKSGKPQLFELGDIKFVIEGRTGQSVKMDINIEG